MAEVDSNSRVKRVASLRELIQPVEDLAAGGGVQLDVVIKAGLGPRGCDRLGMSAILDGAQIDIDETDTTTAQFAEGYATYLELWSARLLEVAQALRDEFPATT